MTLSQEQRAILDTFVSEYEEGFGYCVKRAFYPHKMRAKFSDDFMLRIVFLLGVL